MQLRTISAPRVWTRRLGALVVLTLVALSAFAPAATAAIRRTPAKPARAAKAVVRPAFPRVIPERLVSQLLEAAQVVPTQEQLRREYGPRCCVAAGNEERCRPERDDTGVGWTEAPTPGAVDVCWADAGDGCGPDLEHYVGVGYEPGVAVASGPRWGEASRELRRRAIRDIFRVFADKQPARQLGAVIYAIGFTESGFNPNAVHWRTRACGVHQFLPTSWPLYAREAVRNDPSACTDPVESTYAALGYHERLYHDLVQPFVESLPEWPTMSEWDRLAAIFVRLYALHNYGQNDLRWLEDDTAVRRIAESHLPTLRAVYDALAALSQPPVRGRGTRVASRKR